MKYINKDELDKNREKIINVAKYKSSIDRIQSIMADYEVTFKFLYEGIHKNGNTEYYYDLERLLILTNEIVEEIQYYNK